MHDAVILVSALRSWWRSWHKFVAHICAPVQIKKRDELSTITLLWSSTRTTSCQSWHLSVIWIPMTNLTALNSPPCMNKHKKGRSIYYIAQWEVKNFFMVTNRRRMDVRNSNLLFVCKRVVKMFCIPHLLQDYYMQRSSFFWTQATNWDVFKRGCQIRRQCTGPFWTTHAKN